jgi:hypothetical protein
MIYNLFYQNEANNNIFKNPLTFIDSLSGRKHIVLYYDNHEFGKKIQYRFIKNGVLSGECCIYSIHLGESATEIKKEMITNGIDVEHFIKRGLLKIFKIPNIMKHSQGVLKGSKEILDGMLADVNPGKSFRMVIRMIDKLNTKDQITANLKLEQYYHSKFDSFNGMVLCHYDTSDCPIKTNNKWIETILDNHHSVIFVTEKSAEGIAFDT